MAEEVRVSDLDTSGKKGIYDSKSFCDSVIIDVNDAFTDLFGNKPVAFCNKMLQIISKMELLKKGIIADLKEKDQQISHYKQLCDELYDEKEKLIQLINELKGESGDGRHDASEKEENV